MRLRRLDRVWAHYDTYFITICTQNRAPVLANIIVLQRINDFCRDSPGRYGEWVDSFVLMPDHIHLLITFTPDSVSLGELIKALKYVLSKREFHWQSSFYDHVLRIHESRSEKWQYIRMNPVRAGLVTHPEEWVYAGRFHPVNGTPLM